MAQVLPGPTCRQAYPCLPVSVPGVIQEAERETHLGGEGCDMWDDEPQSTLVAGQGMKRMVGQTASPLLVPAPGLPCPTRLG